MTQLSNLEFFVANWLKDVQRRGMELYASANGKTGQGKSLSSDSASARSQKQRKASRRAAPHSERIPTDAGGSVLSFYGAYTNDSNSNQKQRPSRLSKSGRHALKSQSPFSTIF